LKNIKKLEFHCELQAQSYEDLKPSEWELVQKALEARNRSHSPYSKFQVGAAVRLANQTIIQGANQENAAYPSGLCAERVALFAAGVQFPNMTFEALAVCVPDTSTNLPFPCGGCLQVMAEYEYKQQSGLELFLIYPAEELVFRAESTRHLMPFSFNESHLPE
tara:strand:+ start:2634 stop:3122 length:489 start_codon:yes stop_codon:yes gene_type:complete